MTHNPSPIKRSPPPILLANGKQLLIACQTNNKDPGGDKNSVRLYQGEKCIHFNMKIDVKKDTVPSMILERAQKSSWKSPQHFSCATLSPN